jgi:hypothetical protein
MSERFTDWSASTKESSVWRPSTSEVRNWAAGPATRWLAFPMAAMEFPPKEITLVPMGTRSSCPMNPVAVLVEGAGEGPVDLVPRESLSS